MPKKPATNPAEKLVKKRPSPQRRKGAKPPAPRLPPISLDAITPDQAALIDSIKDGPRGTFSNNGPFAIFLQAPGYGMLAQKLGGFLRFQTSLPPRLSEFAILCTGRYWKAQFEWHAHATIAAAQGVKAAAIRDLHAGRKPNSAPRDEKAIYDFVDELYSKRRVSDAAYARVHNVLGDAGTVELVGILGYYALISMTLNVFRVPLPEGAPLPFHEPAG
jgi:4-carboxymuconolactone decarboxylase